MLAPLLAVLVCAEPTQAMWISSAPRSAALLLPAALLTQEEVENAPVDMLNMKQLLSEEVRLSSPPSLVAPALMTGVGSGVSIGFGLLTGAVGYAASQARGWDVLGWVFLGIVTGAIAVAGGVVAIVGGVLLPTKLAQRDSYAARQAAVRERMAAIRGGKVLEPPPTPEEQSPAAARELTKLEEQRPGLGLPISLMAVGAAAAGVGGMYWYTSSRSGSTGSSATSSMVLAIAFLVGGIACEGLGIFFLISRLQQRQEIDGQIEDLRGPQMQPGAPPPPPPDAPLTPPPPPPAAMQVPAPPVMFSYAWSF